MFSEAKPTKPQDTRAHILHTALALFREKGFDASTMRDIATGADMSLGAAYYYFSSKESIVLAFYEEVQKEHRRRVQSALPDAKDFRARLDVLFQTKLDVIKDDRNLLGALLRYMGEPGHPLSVLGRQTWTIREDARELIVEAIAEHDIPEDLRDLVVGGLWGLQMSLILYALYDYSPDLSRTRRLTDGVLDIFVQLLGMASISVLQPVLKPVRARLLSLLRDAGLLPPAPAFRGLQAAPLLGASH
jgi:AcrR family transcriptional regulator